MDMEKREALIQAFKDLDEYQREAKGGVQITITVEANFFDEVECGQQSHTYIKPKDGEVLALSDVAWAAVDGAKYAIGDLIEDVNEFYANRGDASEFPGESGEPEE